MTRPRRHPRGGWVVVIAAGWAAAVAVNRSLRRVHGPSMQPCLRDGDLVLTMQVVGSVRPGDVVVADVPGVGPTIKRVVGRPHEDVALDAGRLVVDGTSHAEPYAVTQDDGHHHWAPGDGVVLLGDDRPRSTDSRRFGRVPVDVVTRRVVWRVRPPQRLRLPPQR